MERIIKVGEVSGNERQLRFIAITPEAPAKADIDRIEQWLRENVSFVLSSADMLKLDTKDHLDVFDEVGGQSEKPPYVVSAGYAYEKDFYNSYMKRPSYPDATADKLVFGSESLKKMLILTGFDVGYELNQIHTKVKGILQRIFEELRSELTS